MTTQSPSELAKAVTTALDKYFTELNGEAASAVYDMVLSCIEKPLLEYVMQHTGGNQSKASEILDINRNTLRKKLQQYNIE